MKTILVPTDFSEAAENAALYALELASAYKKTKVILFHVYSVQAAMSDIPVMPSPFDQMEITYKGLLKEFEEKLKNTNTDVETELIVSPGFVVDEILYLLAKRRIDMVIMGVTGAGKNETIFGSNATSVLKEAKQPVLIIHKEAKFKKPERIALACDYIAIMPDEVIEKIRGFVKLFDAKLLIFDILKKTEVLSYQKAVAEVNLENSLDDISHSLFFPSGDNLPEEINNFVKENKADMLIMMPHNYPFLQGLFHRSNTRKMAFHTHVPLLSIHE
jgi:nucleotide-binding universal stress UspA family protein